MLLVTSLAAAGGVASASSAAAADPTVTVLSSNDNTNFNQVLATCSALSGETCSITRSAEATRTVDVALGLSRAFVTAKLNISSASTQKVSVKCSQTMTTTHPRLYAYPAGRQIFYKITANGRTSGTLMAFNPDPASVFCTAPLGG